MKIAVFIDTQNMYFALKNSRSAKLDYPKLVEYIEDLGEIVLAYGYGFQGEESISFITMLRAIGITPKFNRYNHSRSVEIACDAMKAIYNNELDLIILVTSDGTLAPLIKHAGHHNIKIMVMAATPSKEFDVAYECIELPNSVLRKEHA